MYEALKYSPKGLPSVMSTVNRACNSHACSSQTFLLMENRKKKKKTELSEVCHPQRDRPPKIPSKSCKFHSRAARWRRRSTKPPKGGQGIQASWEGHVTIYPSRDRGK